MATTCVYRWKMWIDQFNLKTEEEMQVLKRCMEVNSDTSVMLNVMTNVGDVYDDSHRKKFREEFCQTLESLSSTMRESSTMKKIFDTVQKHVRENDTSDIFIINYDANTLDPNYQLYKQESSKEFLRKVGEMTKGMIHDNGLTYQYKPGMMIQSGNVAYNPNSAGAYASMFGPNHSQFVKSDLRTIRTVEKIVTFHENNWRVVYTVSMNKDERYVHRLEAYDFNDANNFATTTIPTDSHYVKNLDNEIRNLIKQLEDNLWTIDRFDKWGGNLDG